MERIQIERLCPIFKGNCLETSCAWWIGEKEECHMFGILQEGMIEEERVKIWGSIKER